MQNANFEGILAASATAVTIVANRVTNNNLSLSDATCPGLPAFETNEAGDCGEGIHLIGTDDSAIAQNIIEKNSGGILIPDETGPNRDNGNGETSSSGTPKPAAHDGFASRGSACKPDHAFQLWRLSKHGIPQCVELQRTFK